jgi:hypothetical protein
VARANASHAAGQNLATFLDELRQDVGTLVVDEVHLLDTELANFLFAEILALAAGPTAGSARTSSGTAFATGTTAAARTAFAASAATTVTAFATGSALSATLRRTLRLSTSFSLRRRWSGSGSLGLFLFL